jgi:hypothetical protein
VRIKTVTVFGLLGCIAVYFGKARRLVKNTSSPSSEPNNNLSKTGHKAGGYWSLQANHGSTDPAFCLLLTDLLLGLSFDVE